MKTGTITPELIPHSEFHTGVWLLASKRPDWYYFLKKRNRNVIANKAFLKSVDKPLQKLVKQLHKKGIKTTPSCSGHHISERNFEKIYESLEKDKEEIRTVGLRLKDVESGEIYFYKNKNYELPWSKAEFVEKAAVYQQKGVIGLRLNRKKAIKRQLSKLHISGVQIKERNSILFFFTNEDNRGDNREMWKKITSKVIHALKHAKANKRVRHPPLRINTALK